MEPGETAPSDHPSETPSEEIPTVPPSQDEVPFVPKLVYPKIPRRGPTSVKAPILRNGRLIGYKMVPVVTPKKKYERPPAPAPAPPNSPVSLYAGKVFKIIKTPTSPGENPHYQEVDPSLLDSQTLAKNREIWSTMKNLPPLPEPPMMEVPLRIKPYRRGSGGEEGQSRSVSQGALGEALLGEKLISTDTHFFDGKLEDLPMIFGIEKLEGEDKVRKVKEARAYLVAILSATGSTPVAINYIEMISADTESCSPANFDSTNNVDAGDVLYAVYERIKTCTDLLSSQLEDMSTGSCPQGRATRLLSVLAGLM